MLSQIQDLVAILHGVEEAVSKDSSKAIVWRVTDATKRSPLTIELTPFPKAFAINIDNRAEKVVGVTALGFQQIAKLGTRPDYFTDPVIEKAERIYTRVINGLEETHVDFPEYTDVQQVEISRALAQKSIEHIKEIKGSTPVAHRELGSIEGYIARIELDKSKRPIVWLRARLDGQMIKCESTQKGLERIGHFKIAEVIEGLRVRIYGLLKYKDLDKIASVDVEGVHVFDSDKELPEPSDIISPNFTKGVESSTYLEGLRDNG